MISFVNLLPISCWPIRHQQVTISVTFLFMFRDNWYLWILSLTEYKICWVLLFEV
jgi:hypothetical protein